jgi:hypothetical protein
MTQVDDVGEYVRKHGAMGQPVGVREIAEELGFTMAAVAAARTQLMRNADDIYPIASSMMAYEPGWKENHPEVWAAAQERTRQVKAGQIKAANKRTSLPNIIGPVTTLHNVVAVNIHPDHVSIQHVDGTFTHLSGKTRITGRDNG